MDFITFLDQAISAVDNAGTYRARVVQTLGEGVKILTAINAADLGENEKAIFSRMLTLNQKVLFLLDGAVPPTAPVA